MPVRLGLILVYTLLLGCGPVDQKSLPSRDQDENVGRATDELFNFGEDLDGAIEIAPGVFQARGTANAQMVVTKEGNVIIDTGLKNQPRVQRWLRAADSGRVSHIVLTHAHADHYSATDAFVDDGTEVIAHEEFEHNQRYLKELSPLLMARNAIFFPENTPAVPGVLSGVVRALYPAVEPSLRVSDRYEFEQGGIRFEVIATPGAEGSDGLSVWLPDQEILFTGDFFGASFPMWPNLTSMRGERPRYPRPYIESLDLVLELDPAILVPSHFEPIRGKENIRDGVQRIRDAVAYVEEAVFDGMNAGKDVHTLMREIRLPQHLALPEPHGKVSWGVRSIWEAYTGWFHLDSTSELYAVPREAVYQEVVKMAGGAPALAARAQTHLAQGNPVEALHLVEIALAADPSDRDALAMQRATLDALLQASGRSNHFETRWLEYQLELNQRQQRR